MPAGLLFVAACAASTDAAPSGFDAGQEDAGAADAATPPDASAPDAGEPDAAIPDAAAPDASVPDAGTVNPPFTPRVWCTQTPGGILADGAAALAFSYHDCCVVEIVCAASADAASSTLDLVVTADDFSEVCDCDLGLAEASCDLPPLAAGTWSVRVNGAYAFELPVLASVREEPGRLCFDPADPMPPAELRCESPAQDWPNLGEACHARQGLDEDHTGVRLVDACGGCFEHFGGCRTAVDGDSLHVTPMKRYCACDTCGACPEVCMRNEARCLLPPLPPGDYRVSFEGSSDETSLQILDYTMLSGALDLGETCASGM